MLARLARPRPVRTMPAGSKKRTSGSWHRCCAKGRWGTVEGTALLDADLRPPPADASRRAADLVRGADCRRYSLWPPTRAAVPWGWLRQNACLDAAHRVRARWRMPSASARRSAWLIPFDFHVNTAFLTSAMIASILLAWLKLHLLGGDLAQLSSRRCVRGLHATARLVSSGRRSHLKSRRPSHGSV